MTTLQDESALELRRAVDGTGCTESMAFGGGREIATVGRRLLAMTGVGVMGG
jgi:hypothetical protein